MALLDMLCGHDLSMLRIALLCDLRKKGRKSQCEGGVRGTTRGACARDQEGLDDGGREGMTGKGGEIVGERGRD